MLFIGSLKAGFVTERSELGSCRTFRVQYPILIGMIGIGNNSTLLYGIYCFLQFVRCLMV